MRGGMRGGDFWGDVGDFFSDAYSGVGDIISKVVSVPLGLVSKVAAPVEGMMTQNPGLSQLAMMGLMM